MCNQPLKPTLTFTRLHSFLAHTAHTDAVQTTSKNGVLFAQVQDISVDTHARKHALIQTYMRKRERSRFLARTCTCTCTRIRKKARALTYSRPHPSAPTHPHTPTHQVWLLGQFRTDREVPEETHAARRLGRELLDAFDNGFAWSASRAVTADFSAERVRCLEELRAAAEWDLRTWLRSLGIASAPPGTCPEAIGVGHAWLGNDASLTQDSNTAPTSVLCALDWHKCGLPVIHPRRHPGLLLQVWAHVPIQLSPNLCTRTHVSNADLRCARQYS